MAKPIQRAAQSPTIAQPGPDRFRERKLVLVVVDLAGFTRMAATCEALLLAAFLHDFYRKVSAPLVAAGGRVVKFMGDACFAVFPEERCADAVDAVLRLEREWGQAVWSPGQSHQRSLSAAGLALGGNVHLATVAEGELGLDDDPRYDIVGAGVNHLFRMGGGAGVRISEPVYRKLPNDRRGPWLKQKPPAMYTHGR